MSPFTPPFVVTGSVVVAVLDVDADALVSLISYTRIQILPSAHVKPITWSMNGFVFLDVAGTAKICVSNSLMTSRCGEEGFVKVASKVRIGREPFRQLPGKWSSDIVCTMFR